MSNSSTITENDLIEPIHPGEVLMADFIEGFVITQNKLAAITPLRVAWRRTFLGAPSMDEVTLTGTEEFVSRERQSAWMHSLRTRTAHIELVFNDGDDGHPLIVLLAHLESMRVVGVGPGSGYSRPRPAAVLRRFAYSRDIIRALDDLGGFFDGSAGRQPFTALGNVDVAFLDGQGCVLGATVAHEGMIVMPAPR